MPARTPRRQGLQEGTHVTERTPDTDEDANDAEGSGSASSTAEQAKAREREMEESGEENAA
jgi:hypothetical protein